MKFSETHLSLLLFRYEFSPPMTLKVFMVTSHRSTELKKETHVTLKSKSLRARSAVTAIATMSLVLSCGAATNVHATTSNVPQAIYGGDINVGIFDTLPGFCVGNNPANSALMATRTIYETLFEKSKSGAMVGLLARFATPSPDQKTWTVTLREGVTFHDGSKFDAAAVVANFNAITGRTALGAYAAAGLAGLASKSYTVGTGTAFTANIKAFSVKSEFVVEFLLDRPQYDFRSTLYASGRFFMRSPAQLADSNTCAQNPIGTGPFKVSSWTVDQLVVTRNADYWRHDTKTNARLPYLDKITFTNVKESSQRAAAIRRGTYDAALFSAATDATFIKDLRLRRTAVREFRSAKEYYPSLWLNQGKPRSPFEHLSARKAVLSCLDRSNFVKVRTRNETAVAKSLVGPTSAMYSTKNFPKYSPKAAKQFVKDYLVETGEPSLTFTFPADTSTSAQANARFLKAMWAECNITANYIIEEAAVVISKAFNATPQISAGQYYNAYDAIFITLLEGSDAAFNIPFLVTNAYSESSTNPVKALFKNSLGPVLGLNHHNDTAIDQLFYDGQAKPNAATAKSRFRAGTAYLQKNAIMGAMNNFSYSLFTTKKLVGVGTLTLPNGKTQRTVSNWGIDWTGVYKKR
jgi:ABC-type transport system substrate-binding protein